MTRPTTASILAALLLATLCTALAALFVFPVPESNRDQMGLVLGALLSAVSTVVGFYFGSSKGSRGKDATIAALSRREGEGR